MCSNGKLFLVLRQAAAQLRDGVPLPPLLGLAQELCPGHQSLLLRTRPKPSPSAHPISLPVLWPPATQELTVLLWARRQMKATIHDALLPHWQDGSCLQSPRLVSSVWNQHLPPCSSKAAPASSSTSLPCLLTSPTAPTFAQVKSFCSLVSSKITCSERPHLSF